MDDLENEKEEYIIHQQRGKANSEWLRDNANRVMMQIAFPDFPKD